MIKIVELTKDNEEKYLDQIVELEQISLEAMKKEGREGQLFDTGREGISEYVHSNENSVIVATDENDKVEAATYVTQGQSPFTYNDITKYFKCFIVIPFYYTYKLSPIFIFFPSSSGIGKRSR